MGDLRNKAAKQERDQRHKEWLARNFPATPLPQPICCEGCQRSYCEVQVFAMPRDWKGPYNFACPACMMLAGYGTWTGAENGTKDETENRDLSGHPRR